MLLTFIVQCTMVCRMADQNEMLGSAEACRILQVDKSTLSRWAADGTLAVAHKLPGRNGAFLFRAAEVERLRAARASQVSA